MPQGNGGNGNSDSSDDLGQTRSKKNAKAAAKLRAPKIHGKGVKWVKKLEFDDDKYPFAGSDIDILLKTDYVRHKTSTVKKGTNVIYWCKYGKKVGYCCTMKAKIVRIDKKVFYMEQLDSIGHDHTENRNVRIYEHYSREKVEVIRDGICRDMKPRIIKNNLKNKKLLSDATMPSRSSLYHKFSRVKRDVCNDGVKITAARFKKLLEDKSYFPENEHETFVADYMVEEYAGEHADDVKHVSIISTPALMKRYLRDQDKEWCLLLDCRCQTNMDGASLVLFGANTFKTGQQSLGIGAVVSRYCYVFYCSILYCTVFKFIALYCTVPFINGVGILCI